jgi:hypothetical protein
MDAITKSSPISSTLSLIIANLIAINLAVYEGWHLQDLMIIYWTQSVIIGWFGFRRIFDLKQFSTKDFLINGERPPENMNTKLAIALYFGVPYGFFHATCLVFLPEGEQVFQGSGLVLAICVVVFYVNHRYSYVYNRELDQNRKPNIGNIVSFAYARILPMHITIVIGGALGPSTKFSLLLFLVMKTVADVIMHKVEHSRWRNQK